MTEPLSRISALASRHAALGSGLEDWNGMGMAWSYSTDPCDEHEAAREAVGMFDMSPLKKVFVLGPDAASALDHLTTRDIGRIAPGQAAYLSILTERGTRALSQALAAGRDVAIELDDHRLPSSLNT